MFEISSEKGMQQKFETNEHIIHIFGARYSPICANCELQKTAAGYEKQVIEASNVVQRNFFMDYFLCSRSIGKKCQNTKELVIPFRKLGCSSLSKLAANVPFLCDNIVGSKETITAFDLEWSQ